MQRKSHVLKYALSGLTDTDNRVLHTVAAFRAPATYATLAALLTGPGKPCPDEPALDLILTDLEDRGLVGWDRRGNRYDLHPVVRGVIWSALDPSGEERHIPELRTYFEAIPAADQDTIKTIDDLAGSSSCTTPWSGSTEPRRPSTFFRTGSLTQPTVSAPIGNQPNLQNYSSLSKA